MTITQIRDFQAEVDAAQQDLDDAIETGASKAETARLLGRVCTARSRKATAEKLAHAATSGPSWMRN